MWLAFNVVCFPLVLTLICLQFDLIFRSANTMHIYYISLKTTEISEGKELSQCYTEILTRNPD